MSRADAPPLPGKVLTITSFANPRIKAIGALALAKNRRESGLFLGEGLKLVTDALDESWPVDCVVLTPAAGEQASVQAAAARARARGADILSVPAAVLGKVTRRDNPQTVIGVFRQRLAPHSAFAPAAGRPVVVLEGIKDPGNLGTIIRTTDAAGGAGVILVGETVDPFGIEAVRATMGSLFHVPVARMSLDEFLDFRRGWHGRVIGTHLSGIVDSRSADYSGPVLLVMGNEQSGLSGRAAAACDVLVRIPQAGRADSLNLAVATGVMLYEIQRSVLPPAGAA